MSSWADKYKPLSATDVVGQSKNVSRIKSWLKTYEPSRSRPLFIYGPPGIGKTTAVHLCCKEVGYKTVEFNASDQRNKNVIKETISTLGSNSRLNFSELAHEIEDAIIFDDIDSLVVDEDRGSIGLLIIAIKHSKKPMIFICNDGQHQKLRSLKDKCEVLEFKKPEYAVIKHVVEKIAKHEGLRVDSDSIRNLAESSDYDIRQVINSLSLLQDESVDQTAETTQMNASNKFSSSLKFVPPIIVAIVIFALLGHMNSDSSHERDGDNSFKVDFEKLKNLDRLFPNLLSDKQKNIIMVRLYRMQTETTTLMLIGRLKDRNCKMDPTFCLGQAIANMTQVKFAYMDASKPHLDSEEIQRKMSKFLDEEQRPVVIDSLEELPGSEVMSLFPFIDKTGPVPRRGMLIFLVYLGSAGDSSENAIDLKEQDIAEKILVNKWSHFIPPDTLNSLMSRMCGSIVKIF